jgi:hypothetical protein
VVGAAEAREAAFVDHVGSSFAAEDKLPDRAVKLAAGRRLFPFSF